MTLQKYIENTKKKGFPQMAYVIIILLLLVLLLFIINRKNTIKEVVIESFETINKIKDYLQNKSSEENINKEDFANSYTKTDIERILEEEGLNTKQNTQVKNMITAISKSTLQDLVAAQSPLLHGPMGPPGQQGPPGTTLIASGKLINKDGSFDKNTDGSSINPTYVATRTQGTNKNSSLSFMDNTSHFSSFQNWQLTVNNQLKNRYDGSCLTMDSSQNNLYMSDCDPNNSGQQWSWDGPTNRIILMTSPGPSTTPAIASPSNSNMVKCIGLSKPETNIITSNVPGCVGDTCSTNSARRFLQVKDCQTNSINPDELWDFV